jgi:hypothetical protein
MTNQKGNKLKNILMLLLVSISFSAQAEQVGAAAPSMKDAVVGSACQDEGTLNDIQSSAPLICTNSVWRKVVFKNEDGLTDPLFYEGRCSIRFSETGDSTAKITLKAGEMADICLPVGWTAFIGVSDNTYDWQSTHMSSIPNVVIVRAIDAGKKSKYWIYPKTRDGKSIQKFEIELRSVK